MAVWKQLTAILRARIRGGTYEPGRALPSEKQLEQEFGVARGTARKAVAQLRSDGLVVTVAGRGSYVADPLPDSEDLPLRLTARTSHTPASMTAAPKMTMPAPRMMTAQTATTARYSGTASQNGR